MRVIVLVLVPAGRVVLGLMILGVLVLEPIVTGVPLARVVGVIILTLSLRIAGFIRQVLLPVMK